MFLISTSTNLLIKNQLNAINLSQFLKHVNSYKIYKTHSRFFYFSKYQKRNFLRYQMYFFIVLFLKKIE